MEGEERPRRKHAQAGTRNVRQEEAGIGRSRETTEETCPGRNSEGQTGLGRNRKDLGDHRGNMSRQELGMSDRRKQAGIGRSREETDMNLDGYAEASRNRQEQGGHRRHTPLRSGVGMKQRNTGRSKHFRHFWTLHGFSLYI
jgi:hypothetical protein